MAELETLTALAETTSLAEVTPQAQGTGTRQRVLLINSGWGSSGFYGPDVLREAARNKVFPAGTHMYINHPTQTEDVERPERDLLDLAAVLATDAVYDQREKGLVGVVETFPRYREVLAEYKDHIGLSIRASGTVEYGEAEGRQGPIVTSLTQAQSIDYVTRAGRGGRIMELLEAARTQQEIEPDTGLLRKAVEAKAPPFEKKDDDKSDEQDKVDDAEQDDKDEDLPPFLKKGKAKSPGAKVSEARNVGTWFESRIHSAFTGMADDMFGEGRLTRDERISLSSAIGDGLQAFTSRVEADCPHLYQRDIWDDPEPAQAAMAENNTKGAPVSGSTEKQTPPDREATSEVTESAREKDLAVKLAEAQNELAEARKATAGELAALKTRLDESDAEKLRLTNDKAARAAVAEALKTAGLHEASHARVVESVCRDLPTVESGTLDLAKLGESIKATIDAENAYVATLAEAAGFGAVRGLGESTSRDADAADIDKQLAEAFAGIGLDEKAALTAAHGRV